jgi:hypothetical protein
MAASITKANAYASKYDFDDSMPYLAACREYREYDIIHNLAQIPKILSISLSINIL